MRKLIAVALLATLVAMPVAAAPVDVDQTGPSITARVLEVVTGWLAKLGPGIEPIGAKNDPDDDDRNEPPPLNGVGGDWDPYG